MKVYYKSKELCILEKKPMSAVDSDTEYFKTKLTRSLLYNADEVWLYNPQNRSFESVKNRRGSATILMSFLVSKGIRIRPDSAQMITLPLRFRFVDDKDHFLFQLKF